MSLSKKSLRSHNDKNNGIDADDTDSSTWSTAIDRLENNMKVDFSAVDLRENKPQEVPKQKSVNQTDFHAREESRMQNKLGFSLESDESSPPDFWDGVDGQEEEWDEELSLDSVFGSTRPSIKRAHIWRADPDESNHRLAQV